MKHTTLFWGWLLIALAGVPAAGNDVSSSLPPSYEAELLIPLAGPAPVDTSASNAAVSEPASESVPDAAVPAAPQEPVPSKNGILFSEIAAMNTATGDQAALPPAITASLSVPSTLSAPPASRADQDYFRLRAAQKVLSPTLEDGYNDAAVFGADAAGVVIVSVDGRRVFQARRDSRNEVIRWNCRNPAGKIVESGTYVAQISTEDGRSVNQSFIVIR